MASPMSSDDVKKLELFIKTVKNNPQLLSMPELKFFKDFIESFGGTIPEADASSWNKSTFTATEETETKMEDSPPEEEEESAESDIELDMEGVIEPEDKEAPEMGENGKIVSEEEEMQASEKRSEAMMAMSDGDLDKAVALFTEAIKLNPNSALLYAKRANVLLKQKRVKAALKDCDEAVKLNPDSAAARKFRGRAHRLLGHWMEAADDLRLACRLDFDEQADEWLKEVQPNATKLEEHKRKYERKREEKEIKAKKERIRKIQEENRKAQEKANQSQSFAEGMPGGMPFGGAGGAPGGMPGMQDIFNDPDILTAMQDPEVAAAFQDVSSNPSNILKYQNNPKVSAVINKLMKKFGGGMPGGGMPGGGMPGGFPGGMPGGFPGGMAGGFPGGFPNSKPNSGDDLD